MDINRSNMDALFQGFQTRFQGALAAVPRTFAQYTTEIPSTTASEIYPYLGAIGGMKEWKGDRVIRNLNSQKLTIVNRKFETTISVSRDDIEDDKYGVYSPMFADLGDAAGRIWLELAEAQLRAAATAKWGDGAAFFGTTRKYGKGKDASVISNKTTAALSAEAYKAARQAMFEYQNGEGDFIGVVPTLLVVGSANEQTAFEILKAELTLKSDSNGAAAVQNAWAGTSQYLVVPGLGNNWFLLDTRRPLKPIGIQQRRMPVLTRSDRDADPNVFMRDEFLYGSSARGESFWTMPHLAYAGIVG